MSSLLQSINNQLTYKKIISFGFLLAITLSIPTTILLVQQQTKISSSASIVKPTIIPRAKQNYGLPPTSPIKVSRIYPFLGKAGDELVILGQNFGTNPQSKTLIVGGITLSENDIDVWQDNLISAFLPPNVKSGLVEIHAGTFEWTSKTPFTIYNENTQTQIKKNGLTLTVVSPTEKIERITYSIVNKPEIEIKPKFENSIFSFDISVGEINHLALYNSTGSLIPFFVNPIEFDF